MVYFTGLSGYSEEVIQRLTSFGLGFIYTDGLWQALIVVGVILIAVGFYKRRPTIEVEKEAYRQLKQKANEKGVQLYELASDLILKGLSES
jgi:uncharacterized membrane protein (Fun14 family)